MSQKPGHQQNFGAVLTKTAGQAALRLLADNTHATAAAVAVAAEMAGAAWQQEPSYSGAGRQAEPGITTRISTTQGAAVA